MTYEQYLDIKKAQVEMEDHIQIEYIGDSRLGTHSYSAWTDYYRITNKDTGESFETGDDMGRRPIEYIATETYLQSIGREDLAAFNYADIHCYERAMDEIPEDIQAFIDEYNEVISKHSFLYVCEKNNNGEYTTEVIDTNSLSPINIPDGFLSWENIVNATNLGVSPGTSETFTAKAIKTFFEEEQYLLNHTNADIIAGITVSTLKRWNIIPENFTDDPYSIKVTIQEENIQLFTDEDGFADINGSCVRNYDFNRITFSDTTLAPAAAETAFYVGKVRRELEAFSKNEIVEMETKYKQLCETRERQIDKRHAYADKVVAQAQEKYKNNPALLKAIDSQTVYNMLTDLAYEHRNFNIVNSFFDELNNLPNKGVMFNAPSMVTLYQSYSNEGIDKAIQKFAPKTYGNIPATTYGDSPFCTCIMRYVENFIQEQIHNETFDMESATEHPEDLKKLLTEIKENLMNSKQKPNEQEPRTSMGIKDQVNHIKETIESDRQEQDSISQDSEDIKLE